MSKQVNFGDWVQITYSDPPAAWYRVALVGPGADYLTVAGDHGSSLIHRDRVTRVVARGQYGNRDKGIK